MLSTLDQLKTMSIVVADTGDITSIAAFQPQDCTTNPTLILKAAEMPNYAPLVQEAVIWAQKQGGELEQQVEAAASRLAVSIGVELTRLVPGRVSTEVDADLSFNTIKTVEKARAIMADYAARGVPSSRILIKIAATWEGIEAARILEKEGINCNLTLVFSLIQAVAAARAQAFLISPFVGRVLDWYKKQTGENYTAETDPGVVFVRNIFAYYKTHAVPTVVMAASFRNMGEIMALAGCDRLTIAPALLAELAAASVPLPRALDSEQAANLPPPPPLPEGEAAFRFLLNEDAMASEKLSEGIRLFSADLRKLKTLLRGFLSASQP